MADSKLKIDIRREKILERLRSEGKVLIAQLSAELGATPVTIRSDLDALERDGFVVRVKGGALLTQAPQDPCRQSAAPRIVNPEKKNAIAEVVAERIRDGSTLFINSGTTSECVAAALKKRKNLHIVTNSLNVATILGDVSSFRVLLLGGEINAQYGFTYGGDAQEQLGRYRADWVILSVDGVSAAGGVTTYHAEEAIIDRIMLGRAPQVLIAADSGKIGKAGFSRVCACTSSLCLVTDSQADPVQLAQLRDCGMEILYG